MRLCFFCIGKIRFSHGAPCLVLLLLTCSIKFMENIAHKNLIFFHVNILASAIISYQNWVFIQRLVCTFTNNYTASAGVKQKIKDKNEKNYSSFVFDLESEK